MSLHEDQDVSPSQKNLVDHLSFVHDSLRRKYKECNKNPGHEEKLDDNDNDSSSWESIWSEHTKNVETLETYSKAMYTLATSIWEPRHHDQNSADMESEEIKPGNVGAINCRISWVVQKCQEYFALQLSHRTDKLKLKLLDVGSCYNPFSKYEDLFEITPLDLHPAPGFENIVYRNDFLQLPVLGSWEQVRKFGQDCDDGGKKGMELVSIPEEYYDIVVFSFVLEYLPSSRQRLKFCQKAKQVLKPKGLVFILRPDSNRMTPSSSRWLKQWKVGLGYVGFKRVFFEKLEHLWCAAYAKLENENEVQEYVKSSRFLNDVKKLGQEVIVEELFKLFSLPQDKYSESRNTIRSDSDNSSKSTDTTDTQLFDELPFGNGN